MEKTVSIRNANITFSIWDLGGQREFINMLPLVCNDAAAILFMFDLSRIATLNNVKEWYAPFPSKFFCSARLTPRDRYRQARGFNKTAVAILVGTKYDTFASFSPEEQAELTKQARRYAKAMKAPLIFSSSSHSINVHKVPAAWVPADPASPLMFFHSPPPPPPTPPERARAGVQDHPGARLRPQVQHPQDRPGRRAILEY